MSNGWIGVDLDGTLAYYGTGRYDPAKVGEPITPMLERVKKWLAEGRDVRIFTARVSHPSEEARISEQAIRDWCRLHLGQVLPVTCVKDYAMTALYDDRAFQVEHNTGRIIGDGNPTAPEWVSWAQRDAVEGS